MSNYNEEAKKEVAEVIEEHILRNYRFAEHDINVNLNENIEGCVNIEYDNNVAPESFNWKFVDVRKVIRRETDYIVDYMDIESNMLTIYPEKR